MAEDKQILVNNLNDGLLDILKHLTCHFCDRIFNNPISLDCAHRFCERCVAQSMEKGMKNCPICKNGSINVRMPQYQLKIYISELINLIRCFHKTYPDNSKGDDYIKFMNSTIKFSQLKYDAKIQEDYSDSSIKESENINSNLSPNKMKTKGKNIFISTPRSELKPLAPKRKGLFAMDTSILINTKDGVCVEDTIIESPVSKSNKTTLLGSISDTHQSKSVEDNETESVNKNKVEPKGDQSDLEFTFNDDLSDLELESDEAPEKKRKQENEKLSQISHMNLPVPSTDLERLERESLSTPNQYKIQKSLLNYSHKKLDEFDRVVQMTTTPKATMVKTLDDNKEITSDSEQSMMEGEWSGSPLMLSMFDSDSELFLSPLKTID